MGEKLPEKKPSDAGIKENKMGVDPIPGLLFRMSIPAILSMTIQAVYNIVDSIYVSHISEEALAAVSLVFPVQMLIVAVGVGTGIGINSLIARRLGEKRFEDADSVAAHGFFLAICSWLVFFVIGLFGSRPFYSWYSSDPALVDYAVSYGSIIVCASIFVFFQFICEKILQGTGDMVLPMISHVVGCVVNIVLDPIMIFGYFGCPAMGIKGAAIATVTGQAFGMIIVTAFIFTHQKIVHVSFRKFRPDWGVIKDIYTVALPGMIMQAIPSFVNVFLNMILISFSVMAVSVLGIYFKLQSFVFMPNFGITQGALPIMSYNFGARNRERMMHTLWLATGAALCIMFAGMLVFLFVPEYLLMPFDVHGEMLTMGVTALRILCFCFIPAAVGIVSSTFFQALGYGMYSLIVTLIRQMIAILPIAYFLSKAIGVNGVWLSFPLAETISLVFSVIMLLRLYRKEIVHIPLKNSKNA